MINKTFGYCRVSSREQNISRQIEALKKFGIDERDIYIDKKSGKNFEDREQYNILVNVLRESDILVVKSLDRLGRNYLETKKNWEFLVHEKKIDIVVLDMPLLDTRQFKDLLGNFISDLILNILSYVAEQERAFIKQRQREGIDLVLKTGKTKTGKPFGRPRIEKPSDFDEVVEDWKNKKITAKEAMKLLNLKPNTFYCMIKDNK